MNPIPELLAPAGNMEKLEIAIHYGADAVYLGGTDFSLRNYSGNFTLDEIAAAVAYAHDRQVAVYVACNIYARNADFPHLSEYLRGLSEIRPDALIVSDPGVIHEAKRIAPHIPLHLSTQANTTNFHAIRFWQEVGISRINAARELPAKDIAECIRNCKMEVEVFVHGAVCMAYSGRCLLSTFMTNRDSNRGMCSHPCRWKYYLMEEKRPGEFIPVMEDDRGLYIFNTRDICLINHLPELIQIGVHSLKIEGRMKGIHYLAATVKSYREALDRYKISPSDYSVDPEWIDNLSSVHHRHYSTGFFHESATSTHANIENNHPDSSVTFLGKVIDTDSNGMARIQVRNKITKGMPINLLKQQGPLTTQTLSVLQAEDRSPAEVAQPNTTAWIRIDTPVKPNDLIRSALPK